MKISALCAGLFWSMSLMVSGIVLSPWVPLAAPASIALFALLIIASIASWLAARISQRNWQARKVADLIDEVLEEQKAAEEDVRAAQKKLLRSMANLRVSIGACLVLANALLFLSGAAYEIGAFLYFAWAGIWFNAGMFVRWLRRLDKREPSPATRERFPLLYQVVDEVFGKSAHVQLNLNPGNNVGVTQDNKGVAIALGAVAQAVKTKEELRQTLIHERAHVDIGDVRLSRRVHRLMWRLCSQTGNEIVDSADIPLRYPMLALDRAIELYTLTANRTREKLADDIVLREGNPQDYLNGLAKVTMFGLFFRNEYQRQLFAGAEPVGDCESAAVAAFLAALPEREAFWRDLLAKELPANVGSHPTFQQRFEACGCPPYRVDATEPDLAYQAEQRDYLALSDQFIYESMLEDYEQTREEQYLEPLRVVNEY